MTDGTNPNQASAGHTSTSGAHARPPTGPEADVSQQCVDITEEFKKGDLSKLQAFLSIQGIIAAEELEEDTISQTLDFYFNLLDILEAEREKAAQIGNEQRPDGEPQPTSSSQKRPRAEPGSDDESDDEEKSRSPRKKIDPKLFAWASRTSPTQLSPDLEKTRIALENFTRDPVFARNSITSQPDCPAFSFEDWDDLVRGKPAKFDHIFSSIHATTLDERQSQKLGDIEFRFDSHEQSNMRSPIETENSAYTETISPSSSPLSQYNFMTMSSTMTKPCASVSHKHDATSSPTLPHSLIYPSDGYKRLRGLEPLSLSQSHQKAPPLIIVETPADVSMTRSVQTHLKPATTSISAQTAEAMSIPEPIVPKLTERWFRRPRYARDFIWDSTGNENQRITLAKASETMPALPRPPIGPFQTLLRSHPNRPLVESVLVGLRNGFWPWADTDDPLVPETLDRSYPLKDEKHIIFSCKQRDQEITVGRFSKGFPVLLPGMQSIPVVVVPKPHSDKLRLTVHHSAGPFPPNSFIDRKYVSVKLDNLHDLGSALLRVRHTYGRDRELVVFKSDVSQAYRRLPMEPRWQIRQVVKIASLFHTDHCNNFGNRGAGGIWGNFFALVLWIAVYIMLLADIFGYVDDAFSWEFADNMEYYAPYAKFLPRNKLNYCSSGTDSVYHMRNQSNYGAPPYSS
ncbi:hypothetical protein BDP27DRAFT_1429428 [Rhodocollybia butyracea]|uniref:Reverse transcriptase domain-containing protein n=1 Tax=Rhodocollybia butyracea TaxID=206335 RepID=A0A9P5PE27_9AGAR|nr:hypothetical protein BDP27DRAFT_1429428 [Rhodocollybia butyracea]